ncbi:serine O-acetyltransferase [Dysgonomonas sp. 511]|uniref:serine O-acetyltransferase n=1 Tax=Dysgonomonas sp. 511 TaxID=2302930 RepID=UPI0013D194EC|nr:serine acetyltransferase [Dysgonomonas sp. 511]NDV78854.1 serine acetyltransferase [Dysgonomonas sp. 511]
MMKKKSFIYDDLYRYIGNRSLKSLFRYTLFTPGFRYIYFLRNCQKKNWLFPLYFFLLRRYSIKYGIQIPYQTSIDRGFRIVHFGLIVIHPGAIIGKNFNIAQGCTVGSSEGKKRGTPIIGDNVCMQPNSVVVGNIKIGNNVLIAPNSFVNFDVPDDSIVINSQNKIIRRDNPTGKYIVYKL